MNASSAIVTAIIVAVYSYIVGGWMRGAYEIGKKQAASDIAHQCAGYKGGEFEYDGTWYRCGEIIITTAGELTK